MGKWNSLRLRSGGENNIKMNKEKIELAIGTIITLASIGVGLKIVFWENENSKTWIAMAVIVAILNVLFWLNFNKNKNSRLKNK